jgi:LDH2 family malate/lactate/ureidoglycolate dehydrogenase
VSTGEGSRAASSSTLGLDAGALTAWVEEILRCAGVGAAAAATTAEGLVDANRRGLDSHGVVLLDMYLPRLRDGVIDGRAEPSVIVDAPAAVLIDGHDGLGHYVGGYALDAVCERARACGVALALVRRSTHFGAASWYSNRAAERGFVALVLSNGGPCMAPLGGRAPILGNNPVAFAAPPVAGWPLPSLDFATSVVAWGRVADAARNGQSIPPAWAMGPDGRPTADPAAALEGALLPAGDYKGFGLAFMTDVLAACVAGSPISPTIVSDGRVVESVGHCLIAIDADRFCDRAAYEESLGRLVEAVHGAPRASGVDPFMIPGEREARTARERAASIPLAPVTVALLEPWAEAFGVPLPAPGGSAAEI